MKCVILFTCVLIQFISLNSFSQTTIYSESFTTNNGLGQNQATYDVTGVTSWSITKTGCTFGASDYFYVNTGTGRFEAKGSFGATTLLATGAVAIWMPNSGAAIDISTYSSVSISVDLGIVNAFADGLLAQVSLDGVNYLDIGYMTTSSSVSTFTATNIEGSNLYFRVLVWCVNVSSSSYIDNVVITGYSGATKESITSGASSWVVPAEVTTLGIYAWGGGGGGSSTNSTSFGGAGGGGGALAYSSITVTPGATCYYSVGTGGTGATPNEAAEGTSGGDTWFNKAANSAPGVNTNGVLAKGGTAATNAGAGVPGPGGASASCVGSVVKTGATGGDDGSFGGGGGGASATIVGNTALSSSTATNGTIGDNDSHTDVVGGYVGGFGGDGGIGRGTGGIAGGVGAQPGGGGGGSDDVTAAGNNGGAGGAGKIVLVYSVPVTYYWVGGTGNWSEFATHWATTSGGATFHTSVPGATNNVVFDANSFSGGGQIVSVDVDAYCKNITWTGSTNSPTLHFPDPGFYQDLFIAGSATFIAAMSFTNSNAAYIYFTSTTTGKTITTNGLSMPSKFIFNGSGGEWTLQDNLTSSSTAWDFEVLTGASVISNGYTISGFGDLVVSGTGSLTLSTSTANFANTATITGTVSISTGTLGVDDTFNATGGNVTFSGAGNLNLGGATNTSLGTFTESTSTVTYDRAGTQGVIAETYYNLVIAGGSGTKTAAGTVNVSNNLTVNASTTYAVAATTTTVTGVSDINGTLTISTGTFDANGEYDATGASTTFTGAGNLYLGAAVTGIGTFTASTSTVTFDGATSNTGAVRAVTYYNVVVAAGTKGLSGTATVLNNFTVNSGATFQTNGFTINITNASGTSDIDGTISISTGTFNVDGTFDATGGNVTFTGAGNLNLGGATVTSLGTLTEATGTVSYDRAGAQTVLAETYYNLTIAGGGSAVKTAGGAVNVSNNNTVDASTTYAGGSVTTTVTGTSDINGTVTLSTGIYDANGTFDATGGAITFSDDGFLYLGSTVTSLGTLTNSFGADATTGSTVVYDAAGAQSVAAVDYYNLTIDGSGTKTLSGNIDIGGSNGEGVLTVDTGCTFAIGNHTITHSDLHDFSSTYNSLIAGTVTLNNGVWTPTYGQNSQLVTSGSITVTGTGEIYLRGGGGHTLGTFTAGSGTVYYTRNGNMNIGSNTFNHLIIDGTSGTKTLTGAIDVNGNLTLTSNGGGVLDVSASNYAVTLAGNWTNNATFTPRSGTVTFDGSSAQSLGGTTSTSFYNLTNSNGSTGLSLGQNCAVTNVLNLNTGLLKTVSYTLAIGSTSANGSITGGGSTNYIVACDNAGTIGYLKHFVNSNAAYSYPIGDASSYTPLTFTLTANVSLSNAFLTIYTKDVKVPTLNSNLTAYLDRYWDVTESGFTTPTYTISYTYVDGDLVGSETGMLPIKKSGSNWYKPTGSSFTDGTFEGTGSFNAGTNTLTWTGLTTFSGFGGVPNGAVALPVMLISFQGQKLGRNNKLSWGTESELNNDYFTIEKSINGSDFTVVGMENGAGTSTQFLQYEMMDNNVEKVINYYRLLQTDFDGKYTVSDLISIDNREGDAARGDVILRTNTLGQEVNEMYRGLVIIVYSNGTSEKVIQ
jgi:hypothetical protein